MSKELQKRILSSIIIIPIALFFIIKGSIFFTFFLFTVFLATSYEWINMSKKNSLIKLIGVTVLIISFYLGYLLRKEEGVYIFIFVVLISVLTDIGGYIFGKFLKGPKLSKVSPNKTYSGAIGGFIISVIGGLIYYQYTPMTLMFNFVLGIGKYISFDLYLLIIILLISLISQLGDLIISYFKRLAKIKDTGKIIPGHGGLLDRVDGIIFAIPFSYIILNF